MVIGRNTARVISWLVSMAIAMGPMPLLRADSSPEPLELVPLLEEALKENLDLVSAKQEWEAARARIPKATGLPAPRIGVEWEEIPKGSLKLNEAMLMYQLVQSLPFPGKLSARRRVAVAEAQVAAARYKQAELEVLTQVKAAYFDLFLFDRQQALQREQATWLQQAVAVAQARYASGLGPQADALQAQGELLEASNDVRVLTDRRAAVAAHVNHLLNRTVDQPLGLPAAPKLEPLTVSAQELTLMAARWQPDWLLFQAAAERAGAAWRLEKRELLPDLETMFELRDPATGPIGPWDLTLAIVLPFWFWTKQRYGVKAALYDKRSAEAAFAAMRNDVTRRIHEHWHQAMASHRTAMLYRDGLIPLAEQATESALAAYRSGQGSFAELVMALRGWTERRRMYDEALVEFEQHVAMLEQASGVSLRRME
ncbi:MAG: hypothetical protein COV75_01185 [Candidatus Omnitrophica bacterium CG11_big_fil_rev_8_21_14_0_20_63_9]|nr:MAG: hypothetical protein COV75_01185 [Candidatus Omnitrophica bacterium CG11_big_fil_rev_8_21_14_0_20_63_9]